VSSRNRLLLALGVFQFVRGWLVHLGANLGHPPSLLVVPQVVHLKNVSVEGIVSAPIATVQVSLSFLPHVGQTCLTVGSGLSATSSFLSTIAISTAFP
jgi:hypothetical protein